VISAESLITSSILRKFKMNDLLSQINTLKRNNKHEELYLLVKEQLKHKSNDIILWIKLAIAVIVVPIVDYETSIACLEKALDIDPQNPIALIILAHIYEYQLGGIDDILLHKIKTLHTNSAEINSMLKYVASWSYSSGKKQHYDLEEQLLKESIQLYDKHVWNYMHLVRLYTRQKRYLEINSLVKKALNNVQKVYSDQDDHDVTDIDEYLNEHIKGIYLTDINVELIQKKLISPHTIILYIITTPLLNFYRFLKERFLNS
jgi:tetratricopeptide (TPR) repeat protein